jgi:hypothetical protein
MPIVCSSNTFAALFTGLATGLFPLVAMAYHPLVTDDTGTQGATGQQLEVGYDWSRTKGAGLSETARAVPFTYTYGVRDNLDVFAGVVRQTDPSTGWSNVGIGAKWRFYDNEASKLCLGLKPELLLPVSRTDEAKGLGHGEAAYGLTLILSQETGFGEIHGNLAVARVNYADAGITDRKTLYRLSVAPVWVVSEAWKLAVDLGLQTNPDRSQDSTMAYVELGAVYSPSKDLDLSLGVIRDLNDGPVTTTSAVLGLTWRF